jgi:uncharacterized membrane protein HdeD (DUF308 family)
VPTDLADFITRSWKVLLVQGIVAVLFGIAALIWPGITLLVLVVIWGFWALVDGILMGVAAFRPGPTGQRVLFGIMAVLGIVAGIVAFTRPGLTAAALTWILGIWLVVRGVFELVGAFSATSGKGLLFLSAALDIVLGILFWMNPVTGAFTIVWVVAILAIIWGIVFVVLSLRVRSAAGQLEQAPAA